MLNIRDGRDEQTSSRDERCITGRTTRERNTQTRTRRTRRTSLHEGKSMLKHIIGMCKFVNYVDKETSSGGYFEQPGEVRVGSELCFIERLDFTCPIVSKKR